jgi:hypothetical protein
MRLRPRSSLLSAMVVMGCDAISLESMLGEVSVTYDCHGDVESAIVDGGGREGDQPAGVEIVVADADAALAPTARARHPGPGLLWQRLARAVSRELTQCWHQ